MKNIIIKKSTGRVIKSAKDKRKIIIGNRIPKDFFITKGRGESDITVHAGSYHLALHNAGIEMCNIINYSSILPAIAKEVPKPKRLIHGSVMESIMAVSTAKKGKRATAGIIFGWLHNRKTGKKHGGLVCEYNGDLKELEAIGQLQDSLDELYLNGYVEKYELLNVQCISDSFIPVKSFGTVAIGLCFLNYRIDIEVKEG